MRDTQPPITNDEEYHGYQLAYQKLTQLVEEREALLIAALTSGDAEQIEDKRFDLLDALRLRQGIIDALRAYERQQKLSA